MNIFEYFEASGQIMYIDHKRERTFWKRDDGAEIVPWDGKYKGWISKDWYKEQKESEWYLVGEILYRKIWKTRELPDPATIVTDKITIPFHSPHGGFGSKTYTKLIMNNHCSGWLITKLEQ